MIGSGWLVIQIGRLRLEGRGNCLVLTPRLGLEKISLLAVHDSRADEADILGNGAEATRVDQSPCFHCARQSATPALTARPLVHFLVV